MHRLVLVTLLSVSVVAGLTTAADTIHFREGGGSGYTDVTFDDTYVRTAYSTTTYGNNTTIESSTSSDHVALIAIKEMFTELPPTSGGADIQIHSATLHLTRYNQGSSSTTVSVYPVTTDWLPDSAGTNENDVSWQYCEQSSATDWDSGDISTSDYDTSVCDTGSWVSNYNQACSIDVTDVVVAMYSDQVNYGLAVTASGLISMRSSEHGTASYRPSLEINYEYVRTTFSLTVNSGTGDGSYTESTVVDIAADTAPSGQEFDLWVGDTAGIANIDTVSTTLTMPAADQEITASYTDKVWSLTVNSGTGDGSYVVGTVVAIAADTAPSGQDFDAWTGDTAGITSVSSSSTNLTMPYGNVEVTATYADKTWTLTVNSGSGDGSYTVDTVVGITADTAPSGQQFDQWVGDTAYVTSVINTSTNVTMPYGNAEVTATYEDIPAGTSETIHFIEGGGTGYVDVDVDDTYIVSSPADDTTHGTEGYNGLQAGSGKVFLIAVKDMFSELSASTNGSNIVIESATLHLTRYNAGTSSITLSVYPITTNWLPDSAGTNENDVSGQHAEVSSSTTWVSGNFSSSDYDSSMVDTGSWADNYNDVADIDVTDVIAEIYSDETNYGMAVFASGSIMGRASENSSGKPSLAITYHYGTGASNYTLTVNSGAGDGNYTADTVVDIDADTAASGKEFDDWTGNTANIANINAASTTITMPAGNTEITATYTDIQAGTPSISSVSDGTPSHKQSITISGSNFGSQGGSILIWDDFEDQTVGNAIQGSDSIIGNGWSCQYNYSGLGARFDNTHTHAGNVAAHIDWGYAPSNTIRAFGLAFPPTSTLYATYWRYMEGDYTTSDPKCNHKQFYFFGNVDNFPQGMALMPAGTGSWGFYVNNSTSQPDWNGTNNINTQGWNWSNTDDTYQRWEYYCKLNDPYTASNGVLTYWKDGVVGRHRTDYRHRFVDGQYTEWRLGHMAQGFVDTAKAWFDDVYLATTQARVEIGNASTWSGCTHREIQIPTSWSSTSITIDFNQGNFADSTTVYLYVVDTAGNVSPGYAVTIQ